MAVMTAHEWQSLVAAPTDLDVLLSGIGCKLYPHDRPIVQYVNWSLECGLIEALSMETFTPLSEIPMRTNLNTRGAEGLLGVLCALGLVSNDENLGYKLTRLAKDFLSKNSLFYIGDILHGPDKKIPHTFLKTVGYIDKLKYKIIWAFYGVNFGDKNRLLNQQTRNLAANLAAAQSAAFEGTQRILDLAGGSGVFSIPLALKHSSVKVVLAELPNAIENVKEYVAAAGLESRYELQALNIFERPWKLGMFDTVFIGNFLHGFDDEACVAICRECLNHLEPGGKIWLHEMLWNENKDGPMITALWNVSMCLHGGRQRTYKQLAHILLKAGFANPVRIPTATAMEMVGAMKLEA